MKINYWISFIFIGQKKKQETQSAVSFKFEPKMYAAGVKIAYGSSITILLLLALLSIRFIMTKKSIDER